MKPNFALSLSSEGIKLLHRAAGGWREVDEVAVSSEDLAGELAVLRKTAASLEPGGVRSKLIIPASQIKYLTLDTMGLSDAARRKSAEAALRDATPYDLSELAYDICMDGAKTHVAAVARETLAEAEAFANEHRFHPVSFVAVPGDAPYMGEPYFGVADSAAALLDPDDFVEPDGIAVVVVGMVVSAPETEPAPEPKAEPQPAPTPAPEATTKAPEEKALPPAPQVKTPPAPEPKAPPVREAKAPAKPEPAPVPEPAAAVKNTTPAPAEKIVAAKAGDQTPDVKDAPKPEVSAPVQQKDEPKAATAAAPAIAQPAPTEGTAPSVERPKTPNASSAPAVGSAAADTTVPPAEPKKPTLLAAKKVSASAPAPSAPSATAFSSRRSPPVGGAAQKPLGGAQRVEPATPQPDSSSLLKPAPIADAPEPVAAKGGFLSRRKSATKAAVTRAMSKPETPPTRQAPDEAERMTVFGARTEQIGGKPRFLGLIMTVVLLVFLAGVAAWAAVFLDDGLTGLLRKEDIRTTASDPVNQVDPEIIRTPDGLESGSPPAGDTQQLAALDPVLSAEDTAVLDAMQDPRAEAERPVITEQEAAARYAVTGIWPLSPDTPLTAPETPVEDVYQSTVDPVSASTDAIALPAPGNFETDVQLAAVASPPPFDLRRDASAGDLLTPTAEGIVAPGGYTLIAAGPPLKPPAVVLRTDTPEATQAVAAAPSPLLGFRPKYRPLGLAERAERSQLGGVTRVELAVFRPALRPRSVQERAREAEEAANAAEDLETRTAAAAAAAAALAVPQPVVAPVASAVQNATRLATAESRRPDTRPRNFARIVQRAETAAPAPAETRVAAAATTAPRNVAPSIPSKTSVARSATVKNAINLRQVNLIGVYGKPSSRRALIRLSNGRYQKVSVGDRLDGGRVAAIDNTELRYTKNGRNVILKMP